MCDLEYIKRLCQSLEQEVAGLAEAIIAFNPIKYALLRNYHRKYAFYVKLALAEETPKPNPPYVLFLNSELSENDAGGKGANLSTLLATHNLPVPPGLVITVSAFHLVLQSNRLYPMIQQQLSRLGPENNQTLREVSQLIQARLIEANLPESLDEEVRNGLNLLGISETPLALRSSAVGEDRQASFAGQFESRLNVSPNDWFTAYKQVLASKYSPHAIYYRMRQGVTDLMTPMAVLVMPTIRANVSGILYTRAPASSGLAVSYMVSGTGESLAGGSAYQAWASYDPLHNRIQDIDPSFKLSREVLNELFQTGQKLEDIFGTPQDVEWVADDSDRLFIVQSRPLQASPDPGLTAPDASYPEDQILARGEWVSSGQVSGRIHQIRDAASIPGIPDQAILVTKEMPPELSLALNKIQGVIAIHGSPACHFASVAREAGIPAICNTHGAEILENDQTVSLDSDHGLVLAGHHFKRQTTRRETHDPGTPVLKKLSEALTFVSPLNLQDPNTQDFSIPSCKSLHDIVRFTHEAGVREMFSLVGRRGLDSYGAKRLVSGLPLVMHVLDVNQGLTLNNKTGKEIQLKNVRSRPMQALFDGLAAPAVKWDAAVLHYDWQAYAKSTADFVNVEKSTQFSSYAIMDEEYLHALLRFGYHFAVVDTIQSPAAEQNYIHFSFKGGGGNETQRFFRIQLIKTILERFLFNVQTTADLLEAAFDRRSEAETRSNLARLGIVLGKTVLLDMRLKNEEHVKSLAETFIKEVHDFFPVQENQ